ncbi:MAG: hypothetical protein QM632_04420 [Micrococcaceae bacterium]
MNKPTAESFTAYGLTAQRADFSKWEQYDVYDGETEVGILRMKDGTFEALKYVMPIMPDKVRFNQRIFTPEQVYEHEFHNPMNQLLEQNREYFIASGLYAIRKALDTENK